MSLTRKTFVFHCVVSLECCKVLQTNRHRNLAFHFLLFFMNCCKNKKCFVCGANDYSFV